MQRLHPAPPPGADATVRSIAAEYATRRDPHPDGRPWIGLCMIASLDGSIEVDGVSGGLSNDNDAEVLRALRQSADLVLVGAGTVRSEGYGAPAKAGQRIGVVTNSADVDVSTDLFTSGAGFLICPEVAVDRGVPTLRAGADRVDLPAAVRRLHEVVPGVAFVQAEGGAILNAALAAHDLIDELNLTVSPIIAGGNGPRLTAALPVELSSRFELAHLLADDDSFLFTRWIRHPGA